MREEMREEEIARFVREGLAQATAKQRERLDRLEFEVVQTLERRRGRRFARWSPRPQLRPAWVLAAIVLFALGFFVGNWTTDPLQAQGVTFVVFRPEAQEVTLAISYPVGGRPEWHDIPLTRRGDLWFISLELPPGTYEYGFKIDGKWWAYDEAADYYVLSANNTVNAVREVKPGDST
jgi:hypothetical protein